MPNTPVFGWPYQALTDAPDGAALGEDLALAIEATLDALFSVKVYELASQIDKTTDTSFSDITDFSIDVEPGYLYYVILLVAYTGSTGGDARFDWGRTGGVNDSNIRRFILALAAGTTTNQDSNIAMPRRDGDTDQIAGGDGGAGSGSTSYIEHVVINPSAAGTVIPRVSQNSASGTLSVTTATRMIVIRGVAA